MADRAFFRLSPGASAPPAPARPELPSIASSTGRHR
jgi:hypothetical protein